MSQTGNYRVARLLEWIAALVGAVNCVLVPLVFASLSLVGLLVLAFVVLRPGLGVRWLARPWLAAGVMLAFVVLGGFSIGFYLVPALVAFVVVGWLADGQAGGNRGTHFGLLVVAAVIQAAVMAFLILIS